MLAFQTFGAADSALPPILIAHGLFGSGRNWRAIATRLAETRRVVTVDMRNHGDSFRAESQTYPDMAADLAEVIAAFGGEADVIGHSMGGKAAMTLALTRPEAVRRLLVADIAPVAYVHGEGHRGLIAAMKGLDLSAITSRREADAALAAQIPERAVRAFLLQSLDIPARRWRLNLDVLERALPDIMDFPAVGAPFAGPVLFLAGAQSDYIRPEHRAAIKALFPKARQAKIPGAGHWLHAENPRAFEAAARVFLDA
ncbi:MAG: alpha/beta fold hydrolase [Alphaproteobacteria bacterium]|nr:MAG: alpha/beta fold hydrolase [Alphaproteobacteria bacterium]